MINMVVCDRYDYHFRSFGRSTKTFYKERGDTHILISRRIKDFLVRKGHSFKSGQEITKLAQECMKKGHIDIPNSYIYH